MCRRELNLFVVSGHVKHLSRADILGITLFLLSKFEHTNQIIQPKNLAMCRIIAKKMKQTVFKHRKSLMNRLKLLLLVLFLSGVSVSAQDVITLRNGDQIRARVTEISQSEIRYKQFDNLEGATRVISRADVFAINYENGTRDVFNPLTGTGTGTQIPQHSANQTTTAQQTATEANRTQTAANTSRAKHALGGNALMIGEEGFVVFGIGAKYQYYATDRFRIDSSFSYFFSLNMWNLSVNGHYLIPLSDAVALYPLAGLGIITFGGEYGINLVGFNIGAGIDFRLSKTLILNIEPKYTIIKEGGIFSARIGLAYRF